MIPRVNTRLGKLLAFDPPEDAIRRASAPPEPVRKCALEQTILALVAALLPSLRARCFAEILRELRRVDAREPDLVLIGANFDNDRIAFSDAHDDDAHFGVRRRNRKQQQAAAGKAMPPNGHGVKCHFPAPQKSKEGVSPGDISADIEHGSYCA